MLTLAVERTERVQTIMNVQIAGMRVRVTFVDIIARIVVEFEAIFANALVRAECVCTNGILL